MCIDGVMKLIKSKLKEQVLMMCTEQSDVEGLPKQAIALDFGCWCWTAERAHACGSAGHGVEVH